MTDTDPAIINVLVVVDAEALVAGSPGGTSEKPTMIDGTLIYMMVRQDNGDFGEGTQELKILAKTQDVIRWRQETLSMNGDLYALPYAFLAVRGAGLISVPEPLLSTVQEPLPDPANPTVPGSQVVKSYFWTSTALTPGETTYAFKFAILDRHGSVMGFYAWDPFIKITD